MWEGKMASSKASRNETAPKHSLQKSVRTPIWQIREERIRKTAPPQRYTQEPPMDTDTSYKISTDPAEKTSPSTRGSQHPQEESTSQNHKTPTQKETDFSLKGKN